MVYHLLITGPPGAGKGTTSQILQEAFGLVHLSMGDMLRAHVQDNDEIGRRIAPVLAAGEFVPDQLTNEIIARRLASEDAAGHGFLIDGYPRTVDQAEFLLSVTSLSGLIYVDLDDDAIIKRLANRRVCPQCGRTYHLDTNPPQHAGVCDLDDHELLQRDDDKPETVRKRLSIYREKTGPVIEFFKRRGVPIMDVPGDFDIETQRDGIVRRVREWQAAV